MPKRIEAIKKLEVPIIVRLADCRLSMQRLAALSPGEIIDLGRTLNMTPESNGSGPLDVLVNNQKIAQGQAVKVGENYGVQVTALADVNARISAMGTS